MPEAGNQGIISVFEGAVQSYSIKLDAFEGPLDLLLHLIRKNEVDIYDIPIALITRQYLDYIKIMKEFSLELAGDFLVMASTLLQIKSQMLLPLPEPEEGEEEQEDPRAELVRRLIEYQRYRDAGLELGERELLGRQQFKRVCQQQLTELVPTDDSPLELDLYQLAEAFRQLLMKMPLTKAHEVASREALSIVDAISQILSSLDGRQSLSFEELFSDQISDREQMIVTFLALLELCRIRLVKVIQHYQHGPIYLMPAAPLDENSEEYEQLTT